jgi:hypothetical protein
LGKNDIAVQMRGCLVRFSYGRGPRVFQGSCIRYAGLGVGLEVHVRIGEVSPRAVGLALGACALPVVLLLAVSGPSAGQDEVRMRALGALIITSADVRAGPILGRAVKLPPLGHEPTVKPPPEPPPVSKPRPRVERQPDLPVDAPSQPEAAAVAAPPEAPPPPVSPPVAGPPPAPPAPAPPDPPTVFFESG